VLEVEEVAFRAWPAEEVQDLEGWRLRFTHGITRRANSVWPNAWQGETPLAERVAAVEMFAETRGILPSYQLTSAAKPEHLDEFLSKRGYSIDAPVSVQTLALDRALPPLAAPGIETSVDSRASADWLSVAVDRGRYAGTSTHELGRRVYLGILARIGPRAGFALAREGTEPVAVGLGVVDGAWLGIFGMITVPEARRRGAAKAILGALSRFGAQRGATRAYLQVEKENVAARAAYASAGFVPAYDYHYRTKFASR
jgi:GNAT superfamily N-acetyltransferase